MPMPRMTRRAFETRERARARRAETPTRGDATSTRASTCRAPRVAARASLVVRRPRARAMRCVLARARGRRTVTPFRPVGIIYFCARGGRPLVRIHVHIPRNMVPIRFYDSQSKCSDIRYPRRASAPRWRPSSRHSTTMFASTRLTFSHAVNAAPLASKGACIFPRSVRSFARRDRARVGRFRRRFVGARRRRGRGWGSTWTR